DIADVVPEPGPEDYKYSRGVVGIAAGSAAYRGAALMCTGAARYGNAGMVHFLDRGDGIAQVVVDHFWDVVAGTAAPASLPRVTAWAVGPGLGTDPGARDALRDVLAAPVPVLVDAAALHLIGGRENVAGGDFREDLRRRFAAGHPTVLTPHQGEFAALGYPLAPGDDRLSAARRAAEDLQCIVVLKGPGTIVASPAGTAYLDDRAGSELGTAGSGDVLSGLTAALLSGAAARGPVDAEAAAVISAAGVALHGMAGSIAAEGGRPVTAPDIISALPDAVGAVRRGRPW
ncbi:MAG: NAD(P)H-hydrate dehydratase, partial [bacterium]